MFALRASLDPQLDTYVHDEYRRLVVLALNYENLHAGDILVTEATKPCKLEGIIDWQGTLAAPSYIHIAHPPAYIVNEHPLVEYPDDGCPGLVAAAAALDGEQKGSCSSAKASCELALGRAHWWASWDSCPVPS